MLRAMSHERFKVLEEGGACAAAVATSVLIYVGAHLLKVREGFEAVHALVRGTTLVFSDISNMFYVKVGK